LIFFPFFEATNSEEREKTMNEVQIIRTCSHVNIVRYKDCFITQLSHGQAVLSIVMEYADDGDLHECIKKQREVKKVYFKEVVNVRCFVVVGTLTSCSQLFSGPDSQLAGSDRVRARVFAQTQDLAPRRKNAQHFRRQDGSRQAGRFWNLESVEVRTRMKPLELL
jgi:hypothetical protein